MNIKHVAAQTALDSLRSQNYFCISTIDKIKDMLGSIGDKGAYQTLSVLHCVYYDKMPKELRDALPELIKKAIGEPALEFTFVRPEPKTVEPITEQTSAHTTETRVIVMPARQRRTRGLLETIFGV